MNLEPGTLNPQPIHRLNSLSSSEISTQFLKCCGSRRWVELMIERRPFKDAGHLFALAEETWNSLGSQDWKEAFSHHPKIGDVHALREKFASTAAWASGEQSGVKSASDETLRRLAEGNAEYERKFGYIFIVCATGKSAEEMLEMLESRLTHPAERELNIATAEQAKITRIRLEKLLSEET